MKLAFTGFPKSRYGELVRRGVPVMMAGVTAPPAPDIDGAAAAARGGAIILPTLDALPEISPILLVQSAYRLIAALAACGGNKAQAARRLGMPRTTLFSKLRRHGLE